MLVNNKFVKNLSLVLLVLSIMGCSTQSTTPEPVVNQSNGSELLIVDCLLPGQIRKLGQGFSYLTQRRPVKTAAVDCEIRGGEYVAFDRADYRTALHIWLPQAQKNNPDAQTYVGEIYEKGYGLAPDYILALHWYKKAANLGSSRAQINLGYLYEKGLGVDKDLVTALNWYRKASGLDDDEIGFASTIETAVKEEYQDELNILKNELESSQSEIETLQSDLDKSRKNYRWEQKKLTQLKTKLNNTNSQLDKLKQTENSTTINNNINKFKSILQEDTAKVDKQIKVVERLEVDLQQHNNELASKLKQAEQRSALLSEELVKHKQEEGQLKADLIGLQTQLASSKLSIAQLNDNLLSEQNKIDQGKQDLNRLKMQAGAQNNSEISKVKSQLELRDKELAERYQLIKKLELEKTQITNEKNALAANQNKTLTEKNRQLDVLNNKLAQQDQNLTTQRSTIAQLEKETKQANISKKQLEQVRNQDFSANDARIKELESRLVLREQTFNNQRTQIKALEKEKQDYERQISQIQTEQLLSYAKPSIEILEPPFSLTRSNSLPTVKLRSAMSHREITGRVIAPAGLLSFNVNGLNEEINSSGLFKAMIELKEGETMVRTVVIDKAGEKAALEFMLLSAGIEAASSSNDAIDNNLKPASVRSSVEFGPYHALIIGNQNYRHFPNLDTPINDAKVIDKILREKYGFKTSLIIDANRYDILSALNKLRSELTEDDNLLVYYAGHGELDRVNLRGHWLPVDAEANNTANWISTIAITDILNAMSAKHVLVVADSCYSGAMTRSSLARLQAGMTDKLRFKWLKLMSKTRSRTVLTSGGLKPVLDSGRDGHSIFANAFIEAISENNEILEGQKLYREVYDNLMEVTKKLNFKQEPQYAPIRHGGHEAGDFFLVAKDS